MRLLVIGGTQFVGRHLVDAAITAGHQVALFNRGQTNPGLFGNIEKMRGDRDGGLFALRGRSFDAVIDTCGYLPRVVRQSAELLSRNTPQYVFISTASVYELPPVPTRLDETAKLATTGDPTSEERSWQTYGPLKALCEQIVRDAYPAGALIVRPGIIAGPHDASDRLTYWVYRAACGGTMVAPGDGAQPVQVIDVRDLAQWIVQMIERKQVGTFNAAGPTLPMTMKRFLEECKFGTGNRCELSWVRDEKLKEAGVG
ncbi:MAG: NAD-dependent epimerase/dehydratase family protein, partial [Terriglobales bacterium]